MQESLNRVLMPVADAIAGPPRADGEDDPRNRVGDFWLPEQGLFALLSGVGAGLFRVHTRGFPEGARLVGVAYQWERRAWLCRFQSAEFAPVPDGMPVPVLGEFLVEFRPEEGGGTS